MQATAIAANTTAELGSYIIYLDSGWLLRMFSCKLAI